MIDRINEWNYYLGEALNRHLETGSFLAVAVVFAAARGQGLGHVRPRARPERSP